MIREKIWKELIVMALYRTGELIPTDPGFATLVLMAC